MIPAALKFTRYMLNPATDNPDFVATSGMQEMGAGHCEDCKGRERGSEKRQVNDDLQRMR